MKIKKYIATSMKEGKEQVIRELGDDAVILSTRTTKNPQGGNLVEIVAAIDDSALKKTSAKTNQIVEKKKFIDSARSQQFSARSAVSNTESHNNQNSNLNSNLANEVKLIKEMLFEVTDYVKYKYNGNHSSVLTKIHKCMIDNEISEELALKATSKINSQELSNSPKEALFEARKIISENIHIDFPIEKSNRRKVVLFVGSTGSGKTLSLIKIAVICKLVMNANILIISADSYKVGGIEQLQTYSSIAGIPFSAAYTNDELREIVDSEMDRDFIFIDTTGKSHKSKEYLSYLKDCADASLPEKIFLVISSTTSKNTFKNIVKELEFLKINSIILTKIDEAETIGGIISILNETNIPISYITNGQKVPDDIEPADLAKLSKLILPDTLFKT